MWCIFYEYMLKIDCEYMGPSGITYVIEENFSWHKHFNLSYITAVLSKSLRYNILLFSEKIWKGHR